MKAPTAQSSQKSYKESWKLYNASGQVISVGGSSTVWVDIDVPKKVVTLTDKASLYSETYKDHTDVTGGTSFTKET
jgi:hypothetical protein